MANLITQLPEYMEAKKIGIYLSMPTGEISTRAIVLHALQENKKVFIPYIYKLNSSDPNGPKSAMDMVSLESQDDYESLQPDPWGIPTPGEETVQERDHVLGDNKIVQCVGHEPGRENLQVIIMPGVAFDRKLSRLGHGKGFYDSFLQRYQRVHVADDSRGNKNMMPFLGKVVASQTHALRKTDERST